MTEEGLRFVGTVMVLGFMTGFSFTVGVWAFCKAFSWAPVNLTVTAIVGTPHEKR